MDMGSSVTRRSVVGGAAALALGGCTATATTTESGKSAPPIDQTYRTMYGPIPEERFPLPAVDLGKVDRRFLRQQVDYPSNERVGTVVVDTSAFYLYHVQEGGKAMRYGVGLGRAGFEWSGRARIAWKRKWPKWTPPEEMIDRQPELAQWSAKNGGMPPSLENPLGARALYIFQGDVDTLYRLHGTREEWSIGRAVSSGCVRLLNQDVIDLYRRVRQGSPILVV